MRVWILLGCIAALLLPAPLLAQRQIDAEDAAARLTIEEFVNSEQSLYGPFDARYVALRLPVDWQLEAGGSVELDLDVFIGGNAPTGVVSGTAGFGGFLEVKFNDEALGQIVLDQAGPQTITLPIPTKALTTTNPDGSHTLAFFLDAGLHCNDAFQTNIVIRNTSRIILPHRIELPPLDLQNLPRPLYQNLPDLEKEVPTAIIVPDQPTAAELRAAMLTAAAFGQRSFNKLPLDVVPASQLASVRATSHLIFVGRTSEFSALSSIDFSSTPASAGAQDSDGVLQMAASPWNPARAVVLVSGASDEATLKAAQALNASSIETAGDPTLALVAAVKPVSAVSATATISQTREFTPGLPLSLRLLDLGYPTRNAFGIGAQYFEYTFSIPTGLELSAPGTFELVFSHSALLNFDVAGMLVQLNNQPVSSVRLSEDTADGSVVNLTIPKDALRNGPNQLLISADLVPNTSCIDPTIAGIWLAVHSDSRLILPLSEAAIDQRTAPKLNTFDETLLRKRSLSELTLVLPENNPQAWSIATQIVSTLANKTPRELFDFQVVFPDQLSAEQRASRDLIVIGQPQELPLLAEWGTALPMTFSAGSNQPVLSNERVEYRLPADASRGYLQILAVPDSPQHILLTILGSDSTGLEWAGRAMEQGRLRAKLDGTTAIVNDEALAVADTSVLKDPTLLGETTAPDATPVVVRDSSVPERPRWILYAIGVAMIMVWMILFIVGVRTFKNRRRSKA